jgi:hypothetical protein
MGRFVYHPHLWSDKDSSVQATLEGVQVSGPPGTRIAQTRVAVESKSEEDHTSKNSTSRHPIKWVLPTKLLSPQTSNEDMSEDIQIDINLQSVSTSSPRTLEAMAFQKFETSDMAIRDADFQVTPPDEMSHLWKDDIEQGFWPEIVDGRHTSGCICWRCWTGCRYKLPNAIMAPIYEKE